MAAGDWKKWLVQIYAKGEDGKSVATGYPLAPDRILTSYHAVAGKEVEVRFVRQGPEKKWLKATLKWPAADAPQEIRDLDVALLEVTEERFEVPLPPGANVDLCTGDEWETEGFPRASFRASNGQTETPAEPLWGTLASVTNEDSVLSLAVTSQPTNPEDAEGVSGAPVVAEGRLVGVLRRWPPRWTSRLQATPFTTLWKAEGFRETLGEAGVRALLREVSQVLRSAVMEITQHHPWLLEAFFQELLVTDDNVEERLERFLQTDTLVAAEVLYRVHHKVLQGKVRGGDPQVVERMVVTALPQLDVATHALEAAIAQQGGSCLVLAVHSPVIAEIAVARLSDRFAYFRGEKGDVVVPTEIPLPESMEISSLGAKEAFRFSLARKLGIEVPHGDRRNDPQRQKRDETLDKRIRARLKVCAGALGTDRITYFCIVGRDDASPVSPDLRKWLAKTYPDLRFLELMGKEDEDEFTITEWLRQIFARPKGEG